MKKNKKTFKRHAFEPSAFRRCMDVCIILGSKSDLPICDKCTAILDEFEIEYEARVASAHRAPKYLEEVVSTSIEKGCKVFIGMAGVSAALPGVIASMTHLTVIGVRVVGKVLFDILLSIVQMPPGVPVACVGVDRGDNAAVLGLQILSQSNSELTQKLIDWRKSKTNQVISDDESLRS